EAVEIGEGSRGDRSSGEPLEDSAGSEGADPAARLSCDAEDPVVVRLEDRLRLVLGQELDLERRRKRDDRDVDLVAVKLAEPRLEIVCVEVDVEPTLPLELERTVAEPGRLPSARERREERLGPEVLVDVEGRRLAARSLSRRRPHRSGRGRALARGLAAPARPLR